MNRRLRTIAPWLLCFGFGAVGACTEATKVNRDKINDKARGGAAGSSAVGGADPGSAGASGAAGAAGAAVQVVIPDVADVVIEGEYPVQLATGLAPTPPMGWSSWNTFACNIKATDVVQVADTIVASGMKDAGYQYVNIDDCWQETTARSKDVLQESLPARDANGNVQVSAKFLEGYSVEGRPGGMQDLINYVHSVGLKIGLYSDRGWETCGHKTGALGYEKQDATQYAAWGIDYLKYDNCAADAATIQKDYQLMRDELKAAVAATTTVPQRPIVYSLCAWNFYEWGIETGQLWRTTTDITAAWVDPSGQKGSVLACARLNTPQAAYNGPNGWNDPDMLEVGVGALANNLEEQRSHFSLWAIMAAPLIAGNNVITMKDPVKAILMNKEVIAIDQDPMGLQGFPVRTVGELEIWMKPLGQRGERAVLLLNTGAATADITMTLADLNLTQGPLSIKNLWTGEVQENVRAPYTATAVGAHASVLLKVKGIEPPPPSGTRYLSDLPWIYGASAIGPIERDLTVGARAEKDGIAITVDGTPYAKGLGVAAGSKIIYRLGKACNRFKATVNLDDGMTKSGSVVFKVYGDDELLFQSSAVMKPESLAETIDVSVVNKYRLTLLVTNGMDTVNSADRGVWADARVECN